MKETLLKHTCKVERKKKIAGKGLTSAWITIANNIRCLALPQTARDNIDPNFVVGKSYNTIFNVSMNYVPLKGDRLTISTGTILLIDGVAPFTELGVSSHYETTCSTIGGDYECGYSR